MSASFIPESYRYYSAWPFKRKNGWYTLVVLVRLHPIEIGGGGPNSSVGSRDTRRTRQHRWKSQIFFGDRAASLTFGHRRGTGLACAAGVRPSVRPARLESIERLCLPHPYGSYFSFKKKYILVCRPYPRFTYRFPSVILAYTIETKPKLIENLFAREHSAGIHPHNINRCTPDLIYG